MYDLSVLGRYPQCHEFQFVVKPTYFGVSQACVQTLGVFLSLSEPHFLLPFAQVKTPYLPQGTAEDKLGCCL